jgi:hypothetical protein
MPAGRSSGNSEDGNNGDEEREGYLGRCVSYCMSVKESGPEGDLHAHCVAWMHPGFASSHADLARRMQTHGGKELASCLLPHTSVTGPVGLSTNCSLCDKHKFFSKRFVRSNIS